MEKAQKGGVIISCSVLQEEVGFLWQKYWPDWEFHTLTSMLHMRPHNLAEKLGELIESEQEKGNKIVLVYGDCCQLMEQFEHMAGVVRTAGVNCCELVLGKEIYKPLVKEGVFFLLPEWTTRWEEVFTCELGLSKENARDFMHDMHTRFMYLDTGVVPVPLEHIMAISRYCELSYEIHKASLDQLHRFIQDAMNRLSGEKI